MPLYTLKCDTCGREVEVLRKPEDIASTRCAADCPGTMRRQFPAPSLPPDGTYSYRR